MIDRKKSFSVWFGCSPFKTSPNQASALLGFAMPIIAVLILSMAFVCADRLGDSDIFLLAGPLAVLKDLSQKRGNLVDQMNQLNDKALEEKRTLTGEESTKWDALDKEQDELRKQIEQIEKAEALKKELDETRDPTKMPGKKGKEKKDAPFIQSDEYRDAFHGYLETGIRPDSPEIRALQADNDVTGGFLVAPQQFVNELIKFVDDLVFIRGLATVVPVTRADSLGAPSLDADPADSDWTAEIKTGAEDSDMKFGKRELFPHPLAKRIKISNKLLRVSAMPVETLVRDRLGYIFGITQEKAFLTGSGSNQPLGVFTQSVDGISAARNVSTGNTQTSIGADGLIEALYTLKAAYWAAARWVFHRDAVKQIRKLKDGDGQYLWQPGLQGGQPDRILSIPFFMSEFAPNTFTAGLFVGIIGDFSRYWIADALNLQIQRLVELYAETNQTGFIGRAELDGMPVLEEAFVRVTLAP